ncbi:MAG: exonuclease subunit SbcD [Bacteroidetes bacterium]|nr:MAG: exonuclease subunit SbcD [Bacteroidota bacterium]
MKILHTADWHLGQRFLNQERQIEHELALAEILQIIENEQVDALILAGDIFDTANPPNYALKQYYNFLRQMLKSSCRHIVVIGGNHDSPATLNAPKELLKFLDIQVVGCAERKENGEIWIEKEILELKNKKGEIEAVVAAVPFLRDRDLKYSISGESQTERIESIKNGIKNHYEDAKNACESYFKLDIPVLATGHLFAAGTTVGGESDEKQEGEHDIHIGNLGKVEANHFPSEFSYIALGHIHKPQIINNQQHIRYSGSIIPLSFSERNDKKMVVLLEYEGKNLLQIREVPLIIHRQLKRFKGSLTDLELSIRNFESQTELTTWAEVVIECEPTKRDSEKEKIKEFSEGKNLEILKIVLQHQITFNKADGEIEADLSELLPQEVFKKKCSMEGKNDAEIAVLEETFAELLTILQENE